VSVSVEEHKERLNKRDILLFFILRRWRYLGEAQLLYKELEIKAASSSKLRYPISFLNSYYTRLEQSRDAETVGELRAVYSGNLVNFRRARQRGTYFNLVSIFSCW